MAGPTDILTAIQNGVVALNNFGQQVKGSFLNISSQLTTLQAAPAITAGPWTVWNPTVVPQAGAFGSASATGAYYAIGKLVHFTVSITVSSVGTAANGMSISLPIGTANRNAAVVAEESVAVGFVGYGRITTGTTTIAAIAKYDNTTYISTGAVVNLTGIYEQT